MSSRAEARSRMSSRSIGVTNVWLRRWMMSCVIRSPSCSQITTSRESSAWSGHCSSMRSSSSAALTMLDPASSNRSKNSRSRGAKSWERRGMAPVYDPRWSSRSGHGAAASPDRRLEALELLGRDAVGVLRTGEAAPAHLLGVGADAAHHLLADRGELLDELGLEALVDGEQVVQNEHLAVRAGARADADDGDLHVLHDHVGHVGGDRLEDDREAAGLLERERVVEH